MTPLVTTAWLAEHLDDPGLVLCDVRWTLKGGPDRRGYEEGHIPGAQFVDLDRDLSASEGPGRHPLPSASHLAEVLSRLGVTRGSLVVGYDDVQGSIAARLWWLLRYFGLDIGRVLDGGLSAWTAEGRPLETGARTRPRAATIELRPHRDRAIDADSVARLLASGALVLDARASERYEGRSEPVDPRAGHIPGAVSAPFAGNLDATGRFLSAADLARRYRGLGALDAERVVSYCGSGVTACHNILALTLLGRDDALLYEGSWSDWSRDPNRPAAVGPEPGSLR